MILGRRSEILALVSVLGQEIDYVLRLYVFRWVYTMNIQMTMSVRVLLNGSMDQLTSGHEEPLISSLLLPTLAPTPPVVPAALGVLAGTPHSLYSMH
jgi:hypothetical protein